MSVGVIKNNYWLLLLLILSLILFAVACNDSILGPLPIVKKIYFTSNRDGNATDTWYTYFNNDVFVMDADGGNQMNITNSPDEDFHSIVLSVKSSKILARSVILGASYYTIMNTDGADRKIITSTTHDNFDASFSPDGQEVIYVSQNPNNEIIITDLDGNEKINLTSGKIYNAVKPCFSSDGSKICFAGSSDDPREPMNIFIIDRTGSNIRQLTNDTLSYYNNLFSLNNREIYFTGRQQNRGVELFSINVDGTRLRKLTATHFQLSLYDMKISPDGKNILFTQNNSNGSNIHSFDIDSSLIEQITFSNTASNGVYTHNYEKILYNDQVDGVLQIYEMNPDGTDKVNLSNSGFKSVKPLPNY